MAILAGVGFKAWLDRRVPSPDADAGRVARYMASPAFAALPAAQKAPYHEAFRRAAGRGELTAEQQRAVTRSTGDSPIRRYFALTGKGRERFLDDVIDRVLRAEKTRSPSPDGRAAKERPVDRGRLADAIPPEDVARMDQFLQDLHDRRVARGVPDDGKFLFGRPD
jgi:hypothetical protein